MLDAASISHAILWLIGAISVLGVVCPIAALCAMGRTAYRKD